MYQQNNKNTRQKLFQTLGIILAGILFFLSSPAFAQQIDSVYTKLDLDQCRQLTRADLGLPKIAQDEMGTDGGQFLCVGYNNSIVYVAEGDLRFFVSYGPNAMTEMAASQTLPQFNYVGQTLEWRVKNINSSWVPFATILRWTTEIGDGSQPDGSFLIVTKLEEGNICHVAYIDARSNENANEIARQYADNEVAGFDCRTDEIFRR